jgi:hypothetical protein
MEIGPLAGICGRFGDIIESSFFDNGAGNVVVDCACVGCRYLDVRYLT